MRDFLLATAVVASAFAVPINQTFENFDTDAALLERGVIDMRPLCHDMSQSSWKKYYMNTFVPNESKKLQNDMYGTKVTAPESIEAAVIGKIPGTTNNDKCSGIPCGDPGTFVNQHCQSAPQWTWYQASIMNYMNALSNIQESYEKALGAVNSNGPGMVGIFAPSLHSSIPEEGPLKYVTAGLGIAGSIASMFPGAGEAIGTVADIGSTILDLFSGGGGEPNLDVKWDAYVSATSVTGTMSTAFNKALGIRQDNALSAKVPNAQSFLTDKTQVPSVIQNGAFAVPWNYLTTSVTDMIQAALYAPAINALWKQTGVVVIKVSKRNLPIDPCVGDNLFSKSVAHCDKEGNMFVLQSPRQNPKAIGADWQDNHKVDGFQDLQSYSLTPTEVMQSAWQSVVRGYGSGKGGPNAASVITEFAAAGVAPPKKQDVAIFDLLVCDFDQNPWKDGYASIFAGVCGPYVEKNALCYFYEYMNELCPQQPLGNDKHGEPIVWPWKPDYM